MTSNLAAKLSDQPKSTQNKAIQRLVTISMDKTLYALQLFDKVNKVH